MENLELSPQKNDNFLKMGNDKVNEFIKACMGSFDLLFHCDIPVAKHVVKKNNRPIFKGRGGKPFLGKSEELKYSELYMCQELRKRANKAELYKPITDPLWAMFLFNFEMKDFFVQTGKDKGRPKKTIPDLSNLYEFPQDCLEEAHVIENDNQIWSHDLSRRRVGQENSIEIYLFKYNESFEPNFTMNDSVEPCI